MKFIVLEECMHLVYSLHPLLTKYFCTLGQFLVSIIYETVVNNESLNINDEWIEFLDDEIIY